MRAFNQESETNSPPLQCKVPWLSGKIHALIPFARSTRYTPRAWPACCHVVHVFDENDEVDDELINLLVVVVLLLEF